MWKEERIPANHSVKVGDWVETVQGEVGEVTQLREAAGTCEIELCVGRCFRHLHPGQIRSILAGAARG